MTDSEIRAIINHLNDALEVFHVTTESPSPAQIRTRRLLQLVQEQLAEDLAASKKEPNRDPSGFKGYL